MTRVTHHLSDELLLAYAAGTLSEGWSLGVATHLAFCPECRRRVLAAEAVGGAMLDEIEAAPVAAGSLDAVLARIDTGTTAPAAQPKPAVAPDHLFPEPLRSYLGGGDNLRWRWLATAQTIVIRTGDRTTTCRLLRIPAGKPMPVHGHRGLELTIVLKGSFHDADGNFFRGDIEVADEGLEHQPIAGPESECICLAVTDAPLRLRGIPALLQPFLRI